MKKTIVLFLLILSAVSVWSQNANNKGTVKGVVRDAKSGEVVPYAVALIYGTTVATMSDSLGRYVIDNAPVGFQRVVFRSVGYKEFVSEPVQIAPQIDRQLDGVMMPEVEQIEEVTVKGRGVRRIEVPPLSTFRINIQEIEKSPGGNRDISKVVQNIPGVTATPAYRNDLIVRGGGPSENAFYLDRIEIPIINHFAQQGASGGNASLINSDFLNSATLYTSAFPVSSTGVLSSVLDMRMTEGNSDRFKTKFSIGASDFALTIDSPLGPKANIIASYRISYLQFLFQVIKLPFLPTYNDAQIKLSYHITPRDNLYIIGLGGYDFNRLNLGLKDDPTLEPSRRYILDYVPENDQWSYVVGAVYNHTTRRGMLTAVVSRDVVDNSLQKWQNNDPALGKSFDYKSREQQCKARLEYAGDLGRGFSIVSGVSYTHAFYDNRTFQKLSLGNNPIVNQYSSELSSNTYAAYLAFGKGFWDDKLRLTLAARVEGNAYNASMSDPLENFSPRFALSYKFQPKWELNASVGRYHQRPLYTTMGFRNGQGDLVNRDELKFSRSDQVSVGFAYNPSSLSRISIEGFYKGYSRYPISLVDSVAVGGRPYDVFAVGAEAVRSVGRGRAYGVELLYRSADVWGFRVNASYTYYRSEFRRMDRDFRPTGSYVSSNWDNEHLATLVLSREIGRGWEAGLRWRFAGGAPYTPYDIERSMNKDHWDAVHSPVYDYSLQNEAKLPPFHQLDLRIDKSWFFKKWTLGIYIDIQNLYNYTSVGQDLLLPKVDPTTGKYVLDASGNYVPALYSNSFSGSLIPTFGLVIEF